MTTLIAPEFPRTLDPDQPAPRRIEGSECEVVNGRIVETPEMGVWETYIVLSIASRLRDHAEARKSGRAISETLFILRRDPLLRRKPDAAFVSAERWPLDRPVPRGEAAWDVIPDLVVEVVSPTDLAGDLNGKIAEYRAAGVRRTWVVYPEQTEVVEFLPDRTARIFGPGEAIDGGDLMPGFTLALNDIFELN